MHHPWMPLLYFDETADVVPLLLLRTCNVQTGRLEKQLRASKR